MDLLWPVSLRAIIAHNASILAWWWKNSTADKTWIWNQPNISWLSKESPGSLTKVMSSVLCATSSFALFHESPKCDCGFESVSFLKVMLASHPTESQRAVCGKAAGHRDFISRLPHSRLDKIQIETVSLRLCKSSEQKQCSGHFG